MTTMPESGIVLFAIGCRGGGALDFFEMSNPVISLVGNSMQNYYREDNSEWGLGARKTVSYGANGTPTTGTWEKGDHLIGDDLSSGIAEKICYSSGTFSASTDSTGNTTNGSPIITGMTDTSDFNLGEYVTVSAGFATGPHKIIAITSTTITIDVNATSSRTNVTVSTPDPVFYKVVSSAI
jgi:hypothetical protein